MKKLLLLFLLVSLATSSVGAYTQHNVESANFIAQKGVINDNSLNPYDYKLDFKITRREMLKVMMKLSWKTVEDTCNQSFSDVLTSDWGCKYAEAALKYWYIAKNPTFRPWDNVTQIEALKMVMQAKWIERNSNEDWREWYKSKAESEWLIDDKYLDYNKNALRGWIFSTSANSFTDFDFKATDVDYEYKDEIEDLFEELLNL